jgi:hypothetical protein
MPNYQTGSGIEERRTRSWLPPPAAWMLYIVFSIILLALLNFNALSHQVWQQQFSPNDFAPVTDRFIHFQDKLAVPAVMLFWVGIGILTYAFIWLAQNIFFIAKSESAQSKYLTGGYVPQKSYWRNAIKSNSFLVILIILWVLSVAIYLRYLMPGFSQLFHEGLYGGTTAHRLINVSAATLGNSLVIYVFWLLSHLLANAWRANRAG